MRFYKKEIRTAIIVTALLLTAYLFRAAQHYLPYASLPRSFLQLARHLIHTGLLMLWIVSLRSRILQNSVRRYLVATASLMLFWLTVRVFKWDYTTGETALNRYCWYAYYIPIITIPLLGVFIVEHIGRPEDYVLPRRRKLLFIPALLLILAVFTNDLHRCVFAFPNGIANYDRDYSYKPVYFIIMAWFVGLGAYFLVQLLMKCRVPGRHRFRALPLIVFAGAVVFWTVYCIFRIPCDLTAIDCLIIFLLLESAIQSGLIRSNSHYIDLFAASSISSVITDREYRIYAASGGYTSDNSWFLDQETMMRAQHGAVVSGNLRLNSSGISGDHVLWTDDISKINELTKELQSLGDQLSGENDLLRAELELREKQARVEEQSRIYDRVTREMSARLDEIDRYLQEIEEKPARIQALLPRICVISAYIKRRGNLLILGETEERIQAKELELCLRESADNLRLLDVFISIDANCQGTISADHAIAAYDLFETVVEQVLDTINALMIHLNIANGDLSLRLEIGSDNIAPAETREQGEPGGTIPADDQVRDEHSRTICLDTELQGEPGCIMLPDTRTLDNLAGSMTIETDGGDVDVRIDIPEIREGGAQQ